jgi:Fe-S oxidoreductase
VVDIESAKPLRYRTMETKLREIEATGAQTLVTSCSDCRRTFDDAREHFEGEKPAASLLEMVAQHLAEQPSPP